MTTRVLVSVIVPVYNTEDYVEECLRSVLAQSVTDLEVLCVDDGSTDRSPEIVARMAEDDPRIRLVEQGEFLRGPGRARNLGIEVAEGEYIAFVDSDDLIDASFLERMIGAARENEADVAMCTIRRFSELDDLPRDECGYDRLIRPELEERPFTWRDIDGDVFRLRFASWNKIYRARFLNENRVRFGEDMFYEDMIFTFKALLLAESLAFVRAPLYLNRSDRPGATTYEIGDRSFDAIRAVESVDGFLSEDPELQDAYTQFEAFRFWKLRRYIHKNDADHVEEFYEAVRRYAENPELDHSPYLTDRDREARVRILSGTCLQYVMGEIWRLQSDAWRTKDRARSLRREVKETRTSLKASEAELQAARKRIKELEARLKAVRTPLAVRAARTLRRVFTSGSGPN